MIRTRHIISFAVALLGFTLPELRADDVPQKEIDAAIDRGAKHLLQTYAKGISSASQESELVTLTLLHAGIPPTHEIVAKAVEEIIKPDPGSTYRTAIRAMTLQFLGGRKYQSQLADCAQFLADNQCTNGQWSYGSAVSLPTRTSTDGRTIEIRQRELKGGAGGDNSNTQYAILGLAACARAAVVVPRELWQRALNWQQRAQYRDGGWGYGAGDGETAAGGVSAYGPDYGSMTCAGIASLVLIQKQIGDASAQANIEKGLSWLAKKFSVKENPGMGAHLYYYLYSLERAGILSGRKMIGDHNWYQEGARFLLKQQEADGSWSSPTYDTCFAILFLKRATEATRSGGAIIETPSSEEVDTQGG